MSDGKLQKVIDHSAEVNVKLPAIEQLAKAGHLQQALEQLASLEKLTRSGFDMISNSRVLISIVQLCFNAKDWRLLQEQIALLCKKHGLIKEAITRMIQECTKYVEQTPDQKTKLEYIDTLRTVTDGKIYVEVERARLTRTLAAIKEKEGQVNEAADILQDVQIETFASMEQREKTDFILEQMRLNLARKDYIRMQIVSRKINTKYFANEETHDLKLRFYELMIQHALHGHHYLDVCKYYREVYQTKSVQADEAKCTEILRYIVMFSALAPFDNEQSDLLNRIKLDKNLEKVPLYKQLIKLFTTNELMRWPKVEEMYRSELQKCFVFNQSNADGVKRWKDIHSRVVEHNIRVIAKYYTRITLRRLTDLLDLTAAEAESALSKLVVSKTIYAKIDRVDGIVSFVPRRDSDEVINGWSNNIESLLGLISKTTHLIAKEEMVQSITQTMIQ